MNRLVTLLALAIALGGPASAQTFYRVAPVPTLPIVAGEINFDGRVLLGSGFTAQRISTGKYKIAFLKGQSDCPVFSITVVSNTPNPPTAEVHAPGLCSRVHYVHFFLPGNLTPLDQTFEFVAVGQP
ncbi:MAG: hypothetical protein WA304_10175 [Candidatus Cybelea sp.]